MKGIIFVPSIEETNWIREILPNTSPAELPIAGKHYIDYALELAEKRGYEMAEVLDWNYSERLAKTFTDLTRFSIPVFYQQGSGEMPKSIEDLARQSSPLTQNLDQGTTTVVWGLRLADFVIRNVSDWHQINMDILDDRALNTHFTLPGYSAEGGVYLGRNVIMEHGVEVKKPVILQDDAWCARNVRLDGLCIIGKGAFIGEGAHLERTVVGDDTYIGSGLELEDKIVIGRRIIDAKTGVWADVDDPGMASQIGNNVGLFGKILDFIRGKARRRKQ